MATYAQSRAGYAAMWKSAVVDPAHVAGLKGIASTILSRKADYVAAEKATGVPWYMIGALHYRESDLNFRTYLGNGDPLNQVTRDVPRGRGPFDSWAEGAVDALRYQGFTKIRKWPITQILYSSEVFNGTGYVLHHENSPYVWAGTNHQERGKYESDGVYNPSKWDTQMGVAAVIKTLMEMDSSIKLENEESTMSTMSTIDTTTTVSPTVPTTPVVVSNPGLAPLMVELDKVIHVLQGLVSYVPMLAGLPFIGDQVRPLLPFVPVAQSILEALDKIDHSGGDLSTIFAEAQKVFAAIKLVKVPGK
jgi:lysozyme family protein